MKSIELNEIHPTYIVEGAFANELVGQWKRTAGGQDANNNRVLEESEKMKLEPGAQDNLNLNSDGKCKVFGMGMELEGTWLVKNYKGKKTLFVYTKDIADLPQDDRDVSAMRFEIVSIQGDKLVVIPPIFSFMLSEYTRSK
jgi:hypothetical protein